MDRLLIHKAKGKANLSDCFNDIHFATERLKWKLNDLNEKVLWLIISIENH